MKFIYTLTIIILLMFGSNVHSFEIIKKKSDSNTKSLAQPDKSKKLMLLSGEFDPLTEELSLSALKNKVSSASDYGVVQFVSGDKEAVDKIINMGGEVINYLPEDSYVVRWNQQVKSELLQSNQFRYVGDYKPVYKMSPGLWNELNGANKSTSTQLHLNVFGFKGSSSKELINAIHKAAPSTTIHENSNVNGMPYARIELAKNQNAVFELIFNQNVMWLDKHHQNKLFNIDSVGPIQSNEADITQASIWAKGLFGTGQIVAVTDSGLDRNQEFFSQYNTGSGAVTKKYTDATSPPNGEVGELNMDHKIIGYFIQPGASAYDDDEACGEEDTPIGFHGTHVAGSVAGDAGTPASANSANYDEGDGMAPHAQILFQDIGDDATGCLSGSGNTYDRINQASKSGAGISSNSYGLVIDESEGEVDGYQFNDFQADLASYEREDILLVWAAGNAGRVGVGHAGQAKNVLTVGALSHGNSRATAFFSSRGPTFDGRVKPDIMAPGVDIISAAGDDDDTVPPAESSAAVKALSGTSMSTPTVAGGAALMRQYFMEGFYPTGLKNTDNQIKPSGALMKSALLNGTLLGNVNPSFEQGWGRIFLDNNLYFAGDSKTLRLWDLPKANGLSTGENMRFKVNVPAGEPFRATLTWFDPPSIFVSSKALVNDMDLEVHFNGEVYKGNNINFNETPVGGEADDINTVEQILLPDPEPGVYEIVVKAKQVNGNETTDFNTQGFALVTSQAHCETGVTAAPTTTLNETDVFQPVLGVQALSNVTDYQVYRKLGGCGVPNSGYQFIGQINTSENQVSFIDEATINGETYGYAVRGVDACGEGIYSSCQSIQSNALCSLSPSFDDSTVTVNNGTGSDCSAQVSWQTATNQCDANSALKYNIYRSEQAVFSPAESNRIAIGVSGQSFNDFTVDNNKNYYYIVTAVDHLGNESTHQAITGIFTSGDQFAAGDYVEDPDGETLAVLGSPWQINTQRSSTGSKSFHHAGPSSNYGPNTCAFMTLPELQIQPGQSNLSYDVAYNIEEFWDGVVVQVSTNGGETWLDLPPDGGYPSDFRSTSPQGQPVNACGFQPSQGAFNGSQNEFSTINTDLSSFAGQNITLRWGFSSDGGLEEDGLYLDNINVSNASSPGMCTARMINKNTSGPWYNPAEDGHGFFMEVSPGINDSPDRLTSYWYTYLDGAPRWVFGTGLIESNEVTLSMLTTDGPQSPPNFDPNDLNVLQWGDLTFDFQDTFNANISWNSQISGFGSGQMPITKIANLSDSPKACYSGSFSNPNESGHGFVVEIVGATGSEGVLVSWYNYDNAGNQIWLLGQGELNGTSASVPVSVFSGADFTPNFDANDVSGIPWGTLNLDFSEDNKLNVNWTADLPGYTSGQLETNRITLIKGKGCVK